MREIVIRRGRYAPDGAGPGADEPGVMGMALAELAAEIGGQVARDMRRPEFRAGLGAALVTAALMARARVPSLLGVAAAVMAGVAVEQFYGMAVDVHAKLTGNADSKV